MFDGMSDDEDEFQSVSECISATHTHNTTQCKTSTSTSTCLHDQNRSTTGRVPPGPVRSLSNTHTCVPSTGEPSGAVQPGGRSCRGAPPVSEPQRGGGAPAHHAERAGHRPGPGQHPRQQRRHAHHRQSGETRRSPRGHGARLPTPKKDSLGSMPVVVVVRGDGQSNPDAPPPPAPNDVYFFLKTSS